MFKGPAYTCNDHHAASITIYFRADRIMTITHITHANSHAISVILYHYRCVYRGFMNTPVRKISTSVTVDGTDATEVYSSIKDNRQINRGIRVYFLHNRLSGLGHNNPDSDSFTILQRYLLFITFDISNVIELIFFSFFLFKLRKSQFKLRNFYHCVTNIHGRPQGGRQVGHLPPPLEFLENKKNYMENAKLIKNYMENAK